MDGIESKDSGFPDIGVAVFKVGAESGYERFEKFNVLRNLLEEAESGTANIFIRMLLENAHISHSTIISGKARTRSLRMALLKDASEKSAPGTEETRTRRGSSLASTFRSRRILDKLPSKSGAVSSAACASRA